MAPEVIYHQRLNLQLLRSEDDAGFAVRSELVHAGRRSSRRIDVALGVGGEAPKIRGRRGVERVKRRRERKIAVAADGDAVCGALFEVVVLGLFPGTRPLCPSDCGKQQAHERQSQSFHECILIGRFAEVRKA